MSGLKKGFGSIQKQAESQVQDVAQQGQQAAQDCVDQGKQYTQEVIDQGCKAAEDTCNQVKDKIPGGFIGGSTKK